MTSAAGKAPDVGVDGTPSAAGTLAVEVTGIHKWFGAVHVLDDLQRNVGDLMAFVMTDGPGG